LGGVEQVKGIGLFCIIGDISAVYLFFWGAIFSLACMFLLIIWKNRDISEQFVALDCYLYRGSQTLIFKH
jgi:hypothetical protein